VNAGSLSFADQHGKSLTEVLFLDDEDGEKAECVIS
jgi:hypothetical protein